MGFEKVRDLFEKCWEELVREYPEKAYFASIKSARELRPRSYWYEADIQLNLAHKLMQTLPYGWVHQEALFDPKRAEEWSKKGKRLRGRPPRAAKPDITIWNPIKNEYLILAEIKYAPAYEWSLDRIRRWQERWGREMSKPERDWYLKDLDKLKRYMLNEYIGAKQGYICIIDEWYPNIKKILGKYSERKIKILAEYIDREEIEKYIQSPIGHEDAKCC